MHLKDEILLSENYDLVLGTYNLLSFMILTYSIISLKFRNTIKLKVTDIYREIPHWCNIKMFTKHRHVSYCT